MAKPKIRLEDFLSDSFIRADYTCNDVINYFNPKDGVKSPEPGGSYYHLAKYFIEETYKYKTAGDIKYKHWLKDIIDGGEFEKSIVLKKLSEFYTKAELEKFVFLEDEADKEHPEYNQKWHFFISYCGYREFATRYPEAKVKKNEASPLTVIETGNKKKYMICKGSPFTGRYPCHEGILWYNHFNPQEQL